jgi:type I restriction enzyme, S subunit
MMGTQEDATLPPGWANVTIGEVVSPTGVFVDGDWVESTDQDPDGDVRLIQLADIGDGCFVDKSKRFLTKKKASDLRCTFLQQGDLLIARMPDPLGRACIFPLAGNEKYVTVVDVCIVRPDEGIVSSRYLLRVHTCGPGIARRGAGIPGMVFRTIP